MPIFNSHPPVPGSVQLTEAEQQALKELSVRPFYSSSEENELSEIQFEAHAKGIGQAIIDELLTKGDHGLDAEKAGAALGVVTEIAYGIGSEQRFGPTRTAEFTIGALRGAIASLGERQEARFSELMRGGLQ